MKVVGDTHLSWGRHSRLRTEYWCLGLLQPFRVDQRETNWGLKLNINFNSTLQTWLTRSPGNYQLCSSKTYQNNKIWSWSQSADAHAHFISFLSRFGWFAYPKILAWREAHPEYLNKPCGVELVTSRNRDYRTLSHSRAFFFLYTTENSPMDLSR